MKLAVEKPDSYKARFSPRRGRYILRREVAGAVSVPGKSVEEDVRRFAGAVEKWRSTPKPSERETPLGRRLREIRARIVASGEPLLSSWDEVDRELGDRRSGSEV